MKFVIEELKKEFGASILATHNFRGDETALVKAEQLIDVLTFLKNKLEFNVMMDLAGVDYLPPSRVSKQLGEADYQAIQKWGNDFYLFQENERFEVVYHLYSIEKKYRVRIRVRLTAENPTIPTISHLWKAANWFEREAFDMFGIHFSGHPNLKRILTFDEFEGFPLRKDFPVNKRGAIPTPASLLDELEKRKKEAIEVMRGR